MKTSPPTSKPERPDDFSVLTCNLRFGLADDGPNSWKHRKRAFPLLFESLRPDFIAFQEANDFQTDFLETLLDGYAFIGKRSPAPRFWQNNILFYQEAWRLSHVDHFFLSPTPQIPSRLRESRWPRQCTLGLFELGDRRLICVNTHFDFSAPVQSESARIVLDRLGAHSPHIPAVLMGDFNALPGRECHEILTSGSGICFSDVFSPPFPGTFHGFTGKSNGKHIDWILYRGEIAPVSRRVITETFDGIHPSDHFPVLVSFRWTESASAP